MFPDIAPPVLVLSDFESGWQFLATLKRHAQYATMCPRLSGKIGLKIEANDTALQTLLKARLHQGAIEIRQHFGEHAIYGPAERHIPLRRDCVSDVIATVIELWGTQPKELIPWLEELLIEAKNVEQWTLLRVEAGAYLPQTLHQTTRQRLQIEGELWKAKNAK